MEAIVEGQGLGKEYLNEKFHEGSQLLSVDCYPKASQSATTIGLAPHSDYGFLTIFLTSGGLEITAATSGKGFSNFHMFCMLTLVTTRSVARIWIRGANSFEGGQYRLILIISTISLESTRGY